MLHSPGRWLGAGFDDVKSRGGRIATGVAGRGVAIGTVQSRLGESGLVQGVDGGRGFTEMRVHAPLDE